MSRSLSPTRALALLVAVLAACTIALGLQPMAAGAAPAPNQTQLSIDPLLVLGMKVAGVKLQPTGPATIGSGGLYFPVGRQNAGPGFVGTVRHQGGFEFLYKNVRFGFRNLVITTKAGSPTVGAISAEPVINGYAIPIGFPISKVTVTSALLTPSLLIGKTKVEIDPNIVAIINKVLGVAILKPGQAWATTETRLPLAPAPTPTPVPSN